MNIQGLQKTTLLDYPGKIACTIFLGGCNFRCPFCHNSMLLDPEITPVMSEDEIFDFLSRRRNIIEGVCVTGGEPTLQADLPSFIEKIRSLGYLIKLDTNGTRPDMIKALLDANLLDYIAMDIKNSMDNYRHTVGVADSYDLGSIPESIELIKAYAPDYEFRTTLVSNFHTEADIALMGKMIAPAKKWFLQCFEESDQVLKKGLSAPNKKTLNRYLSIASEFASLVSLRGIQE